MLLRALVWQHRSSASRRFLSHGTAELYSGVTSRGLTNREIEIKLRVADAPLILSKLRRLRAASRGRVFERNTLYDAPDFALRRAGCILRLRTETPAARGRAKGKAATLFSKRARAVLAMKAPVLSASRRYKERLERESPIGNSNGWLAILRSVGFHEVFRYEKYRTAFRVRRLEVDLDETPIGTFLELEGAPDNIDRMARTLGYSPQDYIRATYGELYANHCRRRAHFPRDMVFPA